MDLLRRIFGGLPSTLEDPVLGRLAMADGYWSGQASWSHTPTPFALTVHRKGETPSQSDRKSFEVLSRNYPGLRSALQAALFKLWTAAQVKNGPVFGSSPDLWAGLVLQGVGLHPDGHAELIYGFADESHPEGAFIVSVSGRMVKALEYVE